MSRVLSTRLAVQMIRVWQLSGEQLTAVNLEAMSEKTVLMLKRRLHYLHDLPVSMQQLALEGCCLDASADVDMPERPPGCCAYALGSWL